MNSILTESLLVILLLMTGLWLLSLRLQNASIVDPFWGVGSIVVSLLVLFRSEAWNPRGVLLVGLTAVWGLRLSAYLYLRNSGHGEDRRYRAMREHHGTRFWWVSLLTVFLLQGVILWIVSFPIQAGILNPSHVSPYLNWTDGLGVIIWLGGFLCEAAADSQMSHFQADSANAGRVMSQGLWRYSRHPNYFGEACVWWGIYLVACSAGAGWTLFSPLLMTFLLLRVSGVTLLEKTIVSRRPEYADYQRRTSAFIPWPPRTRT